MKKSIIIYFLYLEICVCLFVLKSLSQGLSFQDVLEQLTTEGSGIKWSNTLADELLKPVRHHFPKRYVFVRNMDDVWGADLVDMKALSKQNENQILIYQYLLPTRIIHLLHHLYHEFESVKLKSKAITPVPGGVGPKTIAMLLRNTLQAAKLQWG